MGGWTTRHDIPYDTAVMWRERREEGFVCFGFGLGHKACLPEVDGVVARIQMKTDFFIFIFVYSYVAYI